MYETHSEVNQFTIHRSKDTHESFIIRQILRNRVVFLSLNFMSGIGSSRLIDSFEKMLYYYDFLNFFYSN